MSPRPRWLILGGVATLALVSSLLVATPVAADEPPFAGTIFLDRDIITASDPTTFRSAAYTGRGMRTMFDRRVEDWITVEAYLFRAAFSDGPSVEVQVNPEFGSESAAGAQARRYARVVGRLPKALRVDVNSLWIHRGTKPFGGGNHNLLIHTGQADEYTAGGILEETLVHEAAHTSLDARHAAAPAWLAAQRADGQFISTYARDNPTREDVAETFLLYLALRYRPNRISTALAATIRRTIPHRVAYFDRQALDASPVVRPLAVLSGAARDGWLRESGPRSNSGGEVRAHRPLLRLGDDGQNRQLRSVLSFRTAAVPNTAVVTRLFLRVRVQGTFGAADPLAELGGFSADVKRGTFGRPALRRTDFQARATRTVAGLHPPRTGTVYTLDLTAARGAVNRSGLTQVRLRFARQDNANGRAELLRLFSGDAARSLRPRLVVQYGSR